MPDVVAIEQERVATASCQHAIDRIGDGAFSRAAQPGKPDHTTAMPVPLLPILARNRVIVPRDLRRGDAWGRCWRRVGRH